MDAYQDSAELGRQLLRADRRHAAAAVRADQARRRPAAVLLGPTNVVSTAFHTRISRILGETNKRVGPQTPRHSLHPGVLHLFHSPR